MLDGILASYGEKHPSDLQWNEFTHLKSGELQITDAPLWDISLAVMTALKFMKAPFQMAKEVPEEASVIFLAFRNIRNFASHGNLICNSYWGASCYCVKQLTLLARHQEKFSNSSR